jgi:pimeloyl-ACP methyl ester carboxylesterase
MKYFIALNVEKYELKKDVVPVDLVWEKHTIKDWVNKVKISKKDIVVGHSLGAAIALIAAENNEPKELHLYSPSPIFTEIVSLLDKKDLEIFGKTRQKEIRPVPKVSCPIMIYVGENESEMMKETALKISKLIPKTKLILIPNKDHISIMEDSIACKKIQI